MTDAKTGTVKKELVKDILRRLHGGLDPEKAKDEIVRRVGNIESAEMAAIEQSLIDEGVPADEIRRFCNVHALLFGAAAAAAPAGKATASAAPDHPLELLRAENRQIEKLAADLSMIAAEKAGFRPDAAAKGLGALLEQLSGVDRHYAVKENALFPHLEKHGFSGPSRVMWGKHNEVRKLLSEARQDVAGIADDASLSAFLSSRLAPLLEEVKGMVFKEESILFPASLEKIPQGEWAEIGRSAREVGYAFLAVGGEGEAAEPAARAAADGAVGGLPLPVWEAAMNALPIDVTFVDAEDKVRWFNMAKDRIFPRTPSVIGRSVQNCHPPQSLAKVNEILSAFRAGTRDAAEFWIELKGRMIHIRYFAVRDPYGAYLGTLETTQDVTGIRKLTGQKRLLDA